MKLKFYGGQGPDYSLAIGKFKVKYKGTSKDFTSKKLAYEFYDKLECGKALWDLTQMPELMECHTEDEI